MTDSMNNETLQRYIEGKSSQQEKEAVAGWLDADEKNKQDFLVLRRMYDAVIWSDAEQADKNPDRKKRKLKPVYELLKIAAVFLIVLSGHHFLFPEKQQPKELPAVMQTIYVPEGQRAELTLADGTTVWLNAKTRLSFPTYFSGVERRVELNGEAYFDVTRDESMKFIVQTEHYQVNVLGTEFNVKAYQQDHQFETALVKGSVEIFSGQTGEKLRLTPEHRAYIENGQLVQAALPNHDHFLWKEGIIAFEKESVKDIFDKLQLYYDIRIEVKNKEIQTALYTGKFRTKDGIEHVLKVLQLRHKFKYTKNNDTNVIEIY
jgi:ferric-dicitrate binding protein FerR (iron transport regulator)